MSSPRWKDLPWTTLLRFPVLFGSLYIGFYQMTKNFSQTHRNEITDAKRKLEEKSHYEHDPSIMNNPLRKK